LMHKAACWWVLLQVRQSVYKSGMRVGSCAWGAGVGGCGAEGVGA
jgi:hypothetical protein